MALTDKQRAALEAAAKERGLDAAKLVAAAEAEAGGSQETGAQKSGVPASAEKPKLFMYLLPFVTVREVRQIWLELDDSFAGDNEVAAAWAAKFASTGSGEPPPE
jgi:hypothetical protein